jgi:transcriptional regulator with XRE-family HTH domain
VNEVILKPNIAEIGRLLRITRERTGRNQADVATVASISPSMLSQIERGIVAPSVETLFAVCSSLDLDMAELFRRLSPAKPVRVVSAAHRMRNTSSSGVVYEQLVASANSGYPAEMFLLDVPAGQQRGISGDGHEGVELGSVLCGRATLTVDSVDYDLNEGDSVSFNCHLPHRLVNAGASVFRAVWVVLPPHLDYLDEQEQNAD